ncbi:uncharacterized protein LOC108680494 [Hyalella azteca]|uniref:Uncharacterized protein LOC108680494 n=1 Tax=Hyalella azteca TaxID=294128 RepID=A0A979FPA4_HYAAZ|nr:uncharacterized protein LOC108680494 [Hyalella azteca]
MNDCEMDLKDCKKFVGIYFDRKEWQVVPKCWLFEKDGSNFCLWPTEENVVDLAMMSKPADSRSWPRYAIYRIAESSDDYNRAVKKMLYGSSSQSERSEDEPSTSNANCDDLGVATNSSGFHRGRSCTPSPKRSRGRGGSRLAAFTPRRSPRQNQMLSTRKSLRGKFNASGAFSAPRSTPVQRQLLLEPTHEFFPSL